MARASVLQQVQFGKESIAGAAATCTKLFETVNMEWRPAGDPFTEFRAAGHRAPSVATPGREWTEVELSGPLDYVEDLYLLLSMKRVTATALASGAYSWVFTPSLSTEEAINTYTIKQGTPTRAARIVYAALSEYGMTWSKDKAPERSGTMLARRYEDNVDLDTNEVQTITPTGTISGGTWTIAYASAETANIDYNANAAAIEAAVEALSTVGAGNVVVTGGPISTTPVVLTFRGALGRQSLSMASVNGASLTGGGSISIAQTTDGAAPTAVGHESILPAHVNVYLADTWADLASASAATNVFSVNAKWANFMGMKKVINSSYNSFYELVPKAFAGTLDLSMEADTTGMALLTTMRAGSTKFIRVKAVGPQIASTGYYFTYQVDGAYKVSKPHTHKDEDGVWAVDWSFTNEYDATAGKFIEFTLYNDIASV